MNIIRPEILSPEKIEKAKKFMLEKIDFARKTFVTTFPSEASVNNVYLEEENVKGWCNGFWTGALWIAYELTKDKAYREVAELQIPTYTRRIKEKLGVEHHDMGFLYSPSCVAAYKLTGNEEAKQSAIMAAEQLISRYHEKGEFIQAWGELGNPGNYRLIIDCLLNIPLLYWASEATGDKKYDDIAFRHFNSTADNIVRSDGTTYHTFYFDSSNGAPLKGVTSQGASDDSCWARGQAWGIYGMMLTYIYHANDKAIRKFKQIADRFISLLPSDNVPFWDMTFSDGSDEPRDSSAAAIAACGFFEAAKHLDDSDPDKEKYILCANRMMAELIDNYLSYDLPECNGLLLHATYSKPGGFGVDELNTWGDYFFAEALIRLITDNEWNLYW